MPRSELETKHQPRSTVRRKSLSVLKRILVLAVVIVLAVLLLAHAGSFLIVNAPERSDVMVVLEGGAGSSRYQQAVKLQKQGYAPRIMVDADVSREVYGQTEAQLAAEFFRRSQQSYSEVCPTVGDSTFAEAADVQRCLQRIGATSALIVTSDFHTRRALSIFRKRLPQYRWSVAASSAPFHDADQYWQHRSWAKSVLDEWEKYLWWKLVDQWRSDVVLVHG